MASITFTSSSSTIVTIFFSIVCQDSKVFLENKTTDVFGFCIAELQLVVE